MPFLPNNLLDEEQKKKLETQSNNSSGGIGISGSSGVLSSANSSTSNANPKAEQKSGSFVNLNQYLDANKDNASMMSSKITGDINQSAQSAQDKINSFNNDAPKSINLVDENNIKSNYFDNVQNLDDSKKNEYKELKSTGGYNGPKDISNVIGFNETLDNTNKAVSKLKQTDTESGRQQLLKDTYNRPNYSQGQNLLDQTLIQNNPNSKNQFQEVRNKWDWKAMNDMLDKSVSEKSDIIQSNVQNSLVNKELINKTEENYINNFMSPIKERANNLRNEAPLIQQRVQNDLTDDILTEETLGYLGLNSGDRIFDLNLNNYQTYDQSHVTEDLVANKDERAKYQALMSLIGQDPTVISSEEKKYSPVKFNKEQFQKDLDIKNTEYTNAYNTQRDTLLNPAYLINPNASNGYSGYIPGALTDRRDLNEATPQEIENYWLPLFKQAGAQYGPLYSKTADAIERSLNEWKDKYNVNRQIVKG